MRFALEEFLTSLKQVKIPDEKIKYAEEWIYHHQKEKTDIDGLEDYAITPGPLKASGSIHPQWYGQFVQKYGL